MSQAILAGHPPAERTAYVIAVASLMTADRQAQPEEVDFLRGLIAAAALPPEAEPQVVAAAENADNAALGPALAALRGSQLRFSILGDLVAFAQADGAYTAGEQQRVAQIAQHLGVNPQQLGAINQYGAAAAGAAQPAHTPEFLQSSGAGQALGGAGIDQKNFLAGLLGNTAPAATKRAPGGIGQGIAGGIVGGLVAAAATSAARAVGRQVARTAMGALFGGGGRSRGSSGLIGSILGSLLGGRR